MKKVTIKETFVSLSLDYGRLRKNRNLNWMNLIFMALKNDGFRAIFLYRIGRWLKSNNHTFLAGMCQRFMHHFAHCWIGVSAEIGSGFLIAHVSGLVIGGGTIFGKNCDVRQNITFGGNYSKKGVDDRQYPIIGDNVSFGAGCVVVGPIHVGSNSIIGANSVVTRDVPEGVIVSGIPAKVIKKVWNSEETGRQL